MATAMRQALFGRVLVRAGVCARRTHRSLRERFFRRMLDNPAGRAILSTSVDTNTTFVWRTCSHPDLPMPAYARCDIVDEDRVGVYHCIARCVRRAFLCGTDSYTGRDYSHRKAWVLDRLRQLAGLFGVEVCDYAIMSNNSQSSRARSLRGTFRIRRRPAACPARRSIRRRSACSCVGSGVSADRHPKVRHAARLDRPGDP
jgi:hypothetical protein